MRGSTSRKGGGYLADYKILIKAVLDEADLQAQLNSTSAKKPVKIKASIQLDQHQIENQIKLWNNAIAKMQARTPAVFDNAAVKQEVNTFNQMIEGFRKGTVPIKDMRVQLDNVRTSVTQVGSAMDKDIKPVMTFGDMFALAAKKVLIWAGATGLIYGALRQIGEGVQYIKDLNEVMTDTQIVTGETALQMGNLARQYNEMATALGSTTLKVASGALELQRAGYDSKTTMDLLKVSTMQATLGNMEAADSTEKLIATLNGFGMSADQAMSVIDKLIQLDNNYATSVKEITTAMQYSAAVANQTGVSFDMLAAMITTVSSVTRMSAETIGQSMKTMLTRMEQVKAGASVDEFGDAVNNVEKSLQTVGIALRSAPDTFRPLGEVLTEIAGKWNEFSQGQQNMIASSVAGVRQIPQFLTLMQNWDDVLKAQILETESAGLAQERYAVYLNSTEAATNRLTAAWEKLVSSTTNSDFIKSLLNIGTTLLNVIDRVGLFNSALVIVGTYIAVNLLVSIPQFTSVIASLSVSLGIATTGAYALSVALGATVIGAVIIGLITITKELNKNIIDTYNNFEKLKTQATDNAQELSSLADEYEKLSKKQEKSSGDISRLLDIQTILNTKYGALEEGINSYSDAINGNSEAIQKNIDWMKRQADFQNAQFLEKNKYAYEEAKNFLSSELMLKGGRGTYSAGMSPEDYVKYLDKQIEAGKDIFGIQRKTRDALVEQIQAAQNLIIEMEHIKNLESGREILPSRRFGGEQLDYVETQSKKAIKSFKDLQDELDKLVESMSSMGDQMESLIEDYNKYGQLGLDQVASLKKTFGEDYIKVLYVENDQIKLNVKALRDLMLARAADALNTAEQAMITGNYTDALVQQYNILLAYYRQLESGASFSSKALENQQKSYQDLLKDTIDMIKQEKEAQKDALQEELNAFKDMIDAKKQALEDMADKRKQDLQDQLDSYKKIIDAELRLIDMKQKESDYNDQVAEKNKEIGDIDNQLLALQFDNSEEAKAKRLQLEAEKVAKVKELTKIQNDYSVDNQKSALEQEYNQFEEKNKAEQQSIERQLAYQKRALDQEYRDFEANIKAKIAAIDDYLRQAGTINSDAMKLLDSRTQEFYNKLLEWNRQFGTSVDNDIIGRLNQAFGLMLQLNSMGSFGGFGETQDDQIGRLERRFNQDLNGNDIIGRHSGIDSGFVGNLPKLKDNEEFAKLMKGEIVLNPSQMSNFMKNILPKTIEYSGMGDIKIDMPITIQGNADASVLSEFKNIVLTTVNEALRDRGTRRNSFSYSV